MAATHLGVRVFERHPIGSNAKLCVSQGNIVGFTGCAIVNAADEKCVHGKGVDGVINDAGGHDLIRARKALPVIGSTREKKQMRCRIGDAVITRAGGLPCQHVIHAVGPNYGKDRAWQKGETPHNGDVLLYGAYSASMARAQEAGCATVCFSLLSAGCFLGKRPLNAVLQVAAKALRDGAYPALREAHLLAFTDAQAQELKTAVRQALASGSAAGAPSSAGWGSGQRLGSRSSGAASSADGAASAESGTKRTRDDEGSAPTPPATAAVAAASSPGDTKDEAIDLCDDTD
jgi:O-acetyl-ADP-ribose deacetylase (regulator of RNase III)